MGKLIGAAGTLLLAMLAGCASFDGRGLQPGQATAQEVEALMGPSATRRQVGAEQQVWYPRQPYGLANYVARIGADGKLIAIEQRLTDENVAKLVREKTTRDQVNELLGPPYKVWNFPRMPREVYEYRMPAGHNNSTPAGLYVQMTPADGIVREVFIEIDPDYRLGDCCGP